MSEVEGVKTLVQEKLHWQEQASRLSTDIREVEKQRDHFHREMVKFRDKATMLETKVERLELKVSDLERGQNSTNGPPSGRWKTESDVVPIPSSANSYQPSSVLQNSGDGVIDLPADDYEPPVIKKENGEGASAIRKDDSDLSTIRSKPRPASRIGALDRDADSESSRGTSRAQDGAEPESEAKAEDFIDFSRFIPDGMDLNGADEVVITAVDCLPPPPPSLSLKRKRSQSPSDPILPPIPLSSRSVSVDFSDAGPGGGVDDDMDGWGSELTEPTDSDEEGSRAASPVLRLRGRDTMDSTPVRIKVEETIVVPADTLNRHLDGLKPLPVATASNLVTRLAFSRAAKGSTMEFLVPITPAPGSRLPANKNLDGSTWGVVWPQLDRNPYMPRHPGEPGVLFSMHMELAEKPWWAVFRPRSMTVKVEDEEGRTQQKKTAGWEYLGDYAFRHVGRFSAAEFRAQRPKVKEWWSAKVLKAKKSPHYVAIRARIYLRKQSRPVTNATVEEIKTGLVSTAGLTVEDVIDAFERGDEAIEVWALECIGYDHEFNRSLTGLSGGAPVTTATRTPQRNKKRQRVKQSTSVSPSLGPVLDNPEASAHKREPSSTPRRSSRVPKPKSQEDVYESGSPELGEEEGSRTEEMSVRRAVLEDELEYASD